MALICSSLSFTTFVTIQRFYTPTSTKHLWALYRIKLLPEKYSGYFNRIFFSYGEINDKIMLTRVFRVYLSFFSGIRGLCNGAQEKRRPQDIAQYHKFAQQHKFNFYSNQSHLFLQTIYVSTRKKKLLRKLYYFLPCFVFVFSRESAIVPRGVFISLDLPSSVLIHLYLENVLMGLCASQWCGDGDGGLDEPSVLVFFKGEVSSNNNVDWGSRKQFYKPNSKSLSRFG